MAPKILPPLFSGALGLASGIAAAAWYVTTRVSPQPRHTYIDDYTFTPWELQIPFEEVRLQSADGLSLSAWWMPHPSPRAVIVGSHGHGGSKDDLLGIGSNIWRAGYSVLLFDYRGRGESDPWPHTLISREVDDLLAAVAYAHQRAPELRLGIVGFSMGAAVALLAAARDQTIAAIVADSSFTSGSDVVSHSVRKVLRVPAQALVFAADELLARSQGYRFSQARPIDVISQIAPRPLLLIHGGNDTLVPPGHALQLFEAAGEPKELWMVDGVEHCGGYFIDRPAYCRRVIAFFDQYLASIV